MLLSFKYDHLIEAGCDEAGRGCLAGPVFAAAVILDKKSPIDSLNDSKKLNVKDRNRLKNEIEQKALAYAVAMVKPFEIDQINILNASFKAMHKAIHKLSIQPELLLIDGNRFVPFRDLAYECIVKGDGKYQSIAAASILAKTYRDAYMEAFDRRYPQYDWYSNKGYPTVKHRQAILKFGPCIHHRRSFKLYPDSVQASFF